MPLPEGVLEVNLGIPVIIVCTKSDIMLHGEKSPPGDMSGGEEYNSGKIVN